MRNRAYSLVVLIFLLMVYNSFSFAQSPQIQTGLSWLTSTQTSTGNWPEVDTTEYYSTAAALDAVSILEPANPAYTTGFQWMTGQIISPTDYLSRRIIALKRAGSDVSSELEGLLLYRNSNGGWGGEASYISDSLDTALALQALKAANYSDTTVLYQAINFLTSNQNPDGGWGFRPPNSAIAYDPSNAYVTALALKTLSAYNSTFNVQSSIQSAAAYLLTKQNIDGGFGSSPSNVYETALSVMSLIESGQGSTPILQNAINYLTSIQASNGSWNDDPYSTALALQALASARPNLSVSSFSFSNNMPQDGETITITATVNNIGLDVASNVVVRFYSGDPLAGGTQIGTDQVIQSLALGSSSQAAVTYVFTGTGSRTIFVVVDPDNLISETIKTDNKASARLWIATAPDLVVYSEDLKSSTFVPVSGTAFTLAYSIRNLGEGTTGTFDVAVYDGNPATGGSLIQTTHISGLNGTEVRIGTFGVTLTGDGAHTLYVVADTANVITETSKTNNTGTVTVQVGGVQKQADIAVGSIALTPSRPHANDIVQISASVRNQGIEDATPFTVEIFNGAPEAGGILIGSQSISLAPGAEQIVTTNWSIPSGIHDIYAVADRTNQIIETDETNNRASVRVMTDMVDISISATDLVFTPSHPVMNDAVALTITVHNTGIKQTGAFNLALYDADPNAGGVLLQTYPISDISGDGSVTLTYTFTASPQTYRFYAVADTENQVTEMYETNNQAIRSLKIKAPGEVLGPDLVPIKIDVTDTTTDPQTLAIAGTAHVTFQNIGDDKIATPFTVLIFEDKDGDGRYTQGVDTALGTGTNTLTLWPEGANMVDVPLSGTVKFLHSPLYALVDFGDAILEQNENNNLIRSGADCAVVPLNPIQPVVKWKWNKQGLSIVLPPVVTHLIDTNNDGRVDDNDIPSLVFSSNYTTSGKLWALRGDTGAEIFSLFDATHPIKGNAYIAVGDINGDGREEIIFPRADAIGVYGYVYDGTLQLKLDNHDQIMAWQQLRPGFNVAFTGMPAFADLDGDGKTEIITGPTAVNADGTVKWGMDYRYTSTGRGTFSVNVDGSASVADLDLDGKQEVIAGNVVYGHDGTVRWAKTSIPDGLTAVANLNDDAYPEIVLVAAKGSGADLGGRVYLLDRNGNVLWGPVYLKNLEPDAQSVGLGGAPVIADFDGDGEPEIGVKGFNKYFVLDRNGKVKRTYDVPYGNADGSYAAPTVFDLNGDGRPEALFNSNGYFRIFDGQTGTLLYSQGFGGAYNSHQNVIVADVDGDGQAEVVAVGYDYTGKTGDTMRVYGSANNNWVNARKIWNQPSYHGTNVNDGGSIPQHEAPSWLLNNSYRCQTRVGDSPNPYLTPNLTASYLRAMQNGTSIDLTIRIGNGGAKEAASGVAVTFYDGDPATGASIGTASTTKTLQPGEYQDLILSVNNLGLGTHHIYAVVDAANTVSECREDDNQTSIDITVAAGFPDLKVGTEDITLPASPYYEGSLIPISANVKNIGSISASNVTVRLYNGNPAAGGIQIGLTQTVTSISAGGTASVTFTFDTLGRAGTNMLYVVLDAENSIIESNETNNTAIFTTDVQPPVLPNLALIADAVQISPTSPQEGANITITATITNRGASVANIPVRFYLGDPAAGGTAISDQNIYPILLLGQTAAVTAVLDTTGWSGQQTVFVKIDPANIVTESSKADNTAFKTLFIQSAGLSSTLALDKAVYQSNETATAVVTVTNGLSQLRNLSLNLVVLDTAGNLIATITQAEPMTIGPNGAITIPKAWNIGKTLAGNYYLTAEIAENSKVVSRASASFSITPDKNLQGKVVTDKISYNPNETATLTSVITSQSLNYIMENLTAKVIVAGVTGQGSGEGSALYTETKNIATLMPEASFTFKSYWNTSTYAPGTYPVTIEVKDASGAVLATGSSQIVINSTVKPSALLKGQVSVDKQSVLSGESISVSYSVTNVGNIDLSSVNLSVQTVHVDNQTVYDTILAETALPMGGAYPGTGVIDTAKYTAKDYLVVLRAKIGDIEETLAGTYFRVEGAPSAPSLSLPGNGSDVETFLPVLTVNNAADPNDDKLTYEFELYSDSGLTNQVTGASGQGTVWTVPVSLTENKTYYWRCRAYDGKLYGDWMNPASFRVNTVNDPPAAPTLSSPADNTAVDTFTPVLVVNNASDPDSSSLTYNFDVALDPDFTQIVDTITGVTSGPSTGSGGTTSWQVPSPLTENTYYYWRAQADDWLITGPWMAAAKFFVNTANDAPTTPTITSPANNAEITTTSSDIVLINSTDPDSTVLTYSFELDTVMTFDSPDIIRSGSIPQGQGTPAFAGAGSTSWHVEGLHNNTQYYVRAKASDGQAESPSWSGEISFFVNATNDAPAIPALANPSDKGAVNAYTPTLSVHNSTDPDKDVLTYEFEVYEDAAMMNRVAVESGVGSSEFGVTSWTVPVTLIENQTYYWQARANDGELNSDWMARASFFVNKANDAPGAPTLSSPANGGSLATLTPTLAVKNATDPDSDTLTYNFEIYSNNVLVAKKTGVPQDSSGITSWTPDTNLPDNTAYTWNAQASDGDSSGPWMDMATFSIHIPVTTINATIDFDPNTLNKTSNGTWVVVYIEFPAGYRPADVDISTVRLEGTIPAVQRPSAVGDHDKDGIPDLMVKFKRSDVINLLPNGDKVTVRVTGTVGTTTFEGVDTIRVIP